MNTTPRSNTEKLPPKVKSYLSSAAKAHKVGYLSLFYIFFAIIAGLIHQILGATYNLTKKAKKWQKNVVLQAKVH
jgi:hypothetical protein